MSLRHLRTLIAVSEQGSFAAAAEAVWLTQSAVSQQMKALEEELGIALFDRSKRPPQLNDQGKALIQRARQLVYLYDGLKDPGGADANLEGLLEIGAVPTALTGMVPRALGALRAAQPSLQVRVVSGLSAELLARVDRGDLDAAIVSEPKPIPKGLHWNPVADEPLMVISPADEPLKDYRDILESRPFIRFNRSAWVGQAIQTALLDMDIEVQETMELDSLEAIWQMVRHGLGVSIVPMRCVEDNSVRDLKTVPFGTPARRRTLGLLERQEHLKTGLTAALYQELRKIGDTTLAE
ncbi:MAG: LysR family transcriptional regulator [Aquisalimonadaceae bacterium]